MRLDKTFPVQLESQAEHVDFSSKNDLLEGPRTRPPRSTEEIIQQLDVVRTNLRAVLPNDIQLR